MPVTFGSVGDIIAVCVLVKDCVDALSSTTGAAPQYQAVIRELQILEKALLEVGVLSRTHATTPELIALFTSADTTIEQCRKALDAFSAKIKPYDQHLGTDSANHTAVQRLSKGTAKKLLWQVRMKDDVARFRAEVVAFSVSLDKILAAATIHTVKAQGDRIDSRVERLQSNTANSFDQQDQMLKDIRARLDEVNQRISSGNSLIIRLAANARKTWLLQLGNELRAHMFNTVFMNLAVYASVERVHESVLDLRKILPTSSPLSQMPRERKFYLIDAIGRQSTITLDWIDSYDALAAVLQVRFKGKPGMKKILKKEYAIQNRVTGKDMDISKPWESFFLPGLQFYMSMVFQVIQTAGTQDPEEDLCPRCGVKSNQPQGLKIICSVCNQEYQYDRTGDFTIATTTLRPAQIYTYAPDAPDSKVNTPDSKIRTSHQALLLDPNEGTDEPDSDDDPASFNHVRIRTKIAQTQDPQSDDEAAPHSPVDSDTGLTTDPFSYVDEPQTSSYPRRDMSFGLYTREEDLPGYTLPRQTQYSYEDIPVKNRFRARRLSRRDQNVQESRESRRPPAAYDDSYSSAYYTSNALDHRYRYQTYAPMYTSSRTQRSSRTRRARDTSISREIVDTSAVVTAEARTDAEQAETPDSAKKMDTAVEKKTALAKAPKATEEDARRAGIPAGYSYRNWDPSEEPIMLLGSVFDANSLGKWIYDWTVFYNGSKTPLAEMAGYLWLLLIQLAGKIKRAEETVPNIKNKESHYILEDFIESGERLWIRFLKVLKQCEDYMFKALKKDETGAKKMGTEHGLEFVVSIFGRDRELEKTEKLMTGMRLWSMRFDANCEDILKRPSA